jgi:hypothetical protein
VWQPNHSEVALKSFERFLSLLATIPDPRRAEGKLYQLPHVLLFSILAIVSGANSYRGIRTFIKVHRRKLNKAFKISWKRPPAHTAIRYILQGLTAADVEKAFREHAANIHRNAVRVRPESLSAFKWNACPPPPEYPGNGSAEVCAQKPAVVGLLARLLARRERCSRKLWRRERDWDPTVS